VSSFSDPVSDSARMLWLSMAPDTNPNFAVETLKAPHRKSAVYRLIGGAPDGRNVIAKRAAKASIEKERLVHEVVLPCLGVSFLKLFGSVIDSQDDYAWLFLEDAGDMKLDPGNPTHRALLTSWLGKVHSRGATCPGLSSLPSANCQYFHKLVSSASDTLEFVASTVRWEPDQLEVISELTHLCELIEILWDRISDEISALPSTLALPGFSQKNVHTRVRHKKLELLPFDFENAFHGPPLIELRLVNAAEYAAIVGSTWNIDTTAVERLAKVGGAFHAIKSIPGERKTLTSSWPARALHKFRYYTRDIRCGVDALSATATETAIHGA
jgi:hypothetical protein